MLSETIKPLLSQIMDPDVSIALRPGPSGGAFDPKSKIPKSDFHVAPKEGIATDN